MCLHPQNRTLKDCGRAHPQPNESADAAGLLPTSSLQHHASITQNGLGVQQSTLPNPPLCPPSCTQFVIVTCCCFFKRCIDCAEKRYLSLPSPERCELENTSRSQQLYHGLDCPVHRLAPSPTDQTVFPSLSSGPHISADAGACKRHCCTRPHLGKRMFGAARRTLARFGLRQRRSVHSCLASTAITEYSSQSSTEEFDMSDPLSGIEIAGKQRYEVDSTMTEISHALPELPAFNEIYEPLEPRSIDFNCPTNDPSPHFPPSRSPALLSPLSQTSISPLNTSYSDVHCSKSASEPQDPSNQTSNEDVHELGNEEDGADHIQMISTNVEHGPASEAADEDQNFPTWETNTLGGRTEFCESPLDLRKAGLQINLCAAPIGSFAESRTLASGHTSCSSDDYTLESPVDLSLQRQLCHGILKFQAQDLALSSPSNQHSASPESSSSDRSASIHDCLCLQELTPPRGPSLSELLGILHFESGKLEGWMPSGLLERMGVAFQSTTEQSLGKLSELKAPELRVVLGPVHRLRPTLDTGLSALNSLVTGQVPHRFNEVISLLFVAYSIVTMLVDEPNQAQFTEALFLDDIEWTNAIACHEDQYAFKMLLQYRWLPGPISAVCTQAHGSSSRGWRSLHPTRTPFARGSIPFEEGRLDGEDASGFRLRTGLNAQICQWYIDYFHRTESLFRRREPHSPATYSGGTPPSFEESVRCDLIRPCMEHTLSDSCNRPLDILERELGNGQISTFDEVASLVISQISNSEPELALSAQIFSTQCRGAQAMYDSRKVRWFLDQIRRAPNRGDVEASHRPLANADTASLHEMSGLSSASSQAVGTSAASSTPPATSPTRKRKRREVRTGPRQDAPGDEASEASKCPYCDQTFSGALCDQKSNLKRHIGHKHRHPGQAPPYVCPKCGKGFDRRDYLSAHKRKC